MLEVIALRARQLGCFCEILRAPGPASWAETEKAGPRPEQQQRVVCKVFASRWVQASPVTARLSRCYFSLKIKHDGIWAGRSRLGLKTSRLDNLFKLLPDELTGYQGLIAYIKYSKFKPDWNRILSRQVRAACGQKVCKCRISNQD